MRNSRDGVIDREKKSSQTELRKSHLEEGFVVCGASVDGDDAGGGKAIDAWLRDES